MYKREKPPHEVENLQAKGYQLDGILKGFENEEDEPIYGDIEVDDFNKLFRNQNLIKELYGKSIKVRLEINDTNESAVAEVTRSVTEDLTRVATHQGAAKGGQSVCQDGDYGDDDGMNERSMMVYS